MRIELRKSLVALAMAWGLIGGWMDIDTVQASVPYTPGYKDPLSESWRWSHHKMLDRMGVRCIAESPKGVFWFGTERGLIRLEGKKWQPTPQPFFENHLVLAVFASFDGKIWAVSNKSVFQNSGNEWKQVIKSEQDLFSSQLNHFDLFESLDGSIWIGSIHGLIQFRDGKINLYTGEKETDLDDQFPEWNIIRVKGISGINEDTDIATVCQVSDSVLWVGKNDGNLYECSYKNGLLSRWQNIYNIQRKGATPKLKKYGNRIFLVTHSRSLPAMSYDLKSQQWQKYPLNRYFEWDSNENVSLAMTADNKVWIGGFGRIFSLEENSWKEYQNPEYPVPSSRVKLFIDSSSRMWVIGLQSDVWSIDYGNDRFESINGLNFQFETKNRESWFLSYEGDVVCYSEQTKEWIKYDQSDGTMSFPVRLLLDKNDRIWAIGSQENTAAIGWFDDEKWHYRLFPELCWSVCETGILEEDGTIWFGALGTNLGSPCSQEKIVRYLPSRGNPENEEAWDFRSGPGAVFGIGKDQDDTLYVGSYLGLYKLKGNQFVTANQMLGLEYPKVDYIGGQSGELWFAVRGHGIFKKENDGMKQFVVENGLASNTVTDILFTNRGIWVGTDRGISRYEENLNTWISKAISEQIVMKRESGNLKQGQSGEIWINQNFREWKKYLYSRTPDNRFKQSFYTIRYKPDTLAPETFIITKPKSINSGDELFVVWDGTDPWNDTPSDALLFSFRMDDGEWSPFLPQKNQFFSSLKPGKHRFSVRACDGDFNVDPTPVNFNFDVIPPVYRQLWFILLIGFLMLIILFQIYSLMLSRQRRLRSELALSVAEAENVRKVNEMKIRFFTNISHEIRTPLTLILDPVRTLMNQKEFNLQLLQLVEQNASRLQRMINQLLDFRKIETGNMEFMPVFGDIIQAANEVFLSFVSMAEEKKIDYQFRHAQHEFYTWFDADKLDKILTNLISNAIKYTPPGGKVYFSAIMEQDTKEQQNRIAFIIKDTGIGIPQKAQTQIFQRYFRADNTKQDPDIGSGIGLAFTHDLVETCGGQVTFESEPGEGTVFRVELPVGLFSEEPAPQETIAEKAPTVISEEEKLSILLIEDNQDLLNYLKEVLSEEYHILLAGNGVLGFSEACEKLPDLIISDVMMPEMDGLEFTKKVKAHEETSHIPVILLTARKSEFQQLEGLKAGADDYITKPFNTEVLKEKIKNVFYTRDRVIRHFKDEYHILPMEIAKNEKDKKFIDQFVSIVREHISESDFKTDDISQEIGMSRTLLYAKIKSITGMAVNEFIQTIRLREAAGYIVTSEKTISEAMFDVGYNNMGHFRKLFKQQYNMLPSEYKNTHIKQ